MQGTCSMIGNRLPHAAQSNLSSSAESWLRQVMHSSSIADTEPSYGGGALASPARMKVLMMFPRAEIERVRTAAMDPDVRLGILSDACRLNALVAVKRAGSGHLGSTFSAMDVVAFLLLDELNTATVGWDSPDRDVYFSSKGHDVPGLYAALYALGVVPQERLARLRRLGGLDGHPDVGVPGIEANSGSLGMGVSKGRGIAWAKRHLGRGGRVVVMLGDGELQEGQNYEGLQAAAHEGLSGLIVVVDRNELQSDKPTDQIVEVGELEERFRTFGWHAVSCDGHSFEDLRATFAAFRDVGTARRRSSPARSRARASPSWSTPRRCARMVGHTAGTPERPTTRRSRVRSPRSRKGSRRVSVRTASVRFGSSRSPPSPSRAPSLSRASPSRARGPVGRSYE